VRSKRNRLALVGVLALALSVVVGVTASPAVAKGKKKATEQATNVPIVDRVSDVAGTPNGVTDIVFNVGKKFKGLKAERADLTLQITGTGLVNYLDDLQARLVSQQGRVVNLTIPGAAGANEAFGPTKYTPNSPTQFCNSLTTACADPDATLRPPYSGTVGNIALLSFYGGNVKGKWTLRIQDSDNSPGQTGVVNLAKLEVKVAKPIPEA
jgi:hypothetical protein